MRHLGRKHAVVLPSLRALGALPDLPLGLCGSKARLAEAAPGGVLGSNRVRAVTLPPGPTTGPFMPCSFPIIKEGLWPPSGAMARIKLSYQPVKQWFLTQPGTGQVP